MYILVLFNFILLLTLILSEYLLEPKNLKCKLALKMIKGIHK